MSEPLHIVLFDIDGTLIRSGGAGGWALERALQVAFGVPQVTMVAINGRSDRGIVEDLFIAHDIDVTEENRRRLHAAYVEELLPALSSRGGRVLPGVLSLLDRLVDAPGVEMGLLTGNTRDGARLKLAHFGLEGYFDWGGFGDEHRERTGVAKSAWQEAERLFGPNCDASRAWVIGDTPADIACARAIGARAVAVATGQHAVEELITHEPDHALEDLSSAGLLLKAWGLEST